MEVLPGPFSSATFVPEERRATLSPRSPGAGPKLRLHPPIGIEFNDSPSGRFGALPGFGAAGIRAQIMRDLSVHEIDF
jgi:hypothetical protein